MSILWNMRLEHAQFTYLLIVFDALDERLNGKPRVLTTKAKLAASRCHLLLHSGHHRLLRFRLLQFCAG